MKEFNASSTQRVSGYERVANSKALDTLKEVHAALKEKGYNPITQIVGYILSGDPTYITSHKKARALITQWERDELLEEIVRSFMQDAD